MTTKEKRLKKWMQEQERNRKQVKRELPKVKKIFKEALKDGFFWVSFVKNPWSLKPIDKYIEKPKNIDIKPCCNHVWVSPPYTEPEKNYGFTWYSWCSLEMPEWITLTDHAIIGYRINYDKIYFIDSRRKMQAFHKKYNDQGDIDWKKIAKEFSGVAFYPYLPRQFLSVRERYGKYSWYTTFDASQIVIWDTEAIIEQKTLHMPKKTKKK